MRFALQLEYNGKAYHGWQIQQNAHSVQAEIEKALSILLGEKTGVTGCGRTDTGVHARCYFLHFETEAIKDTNKFLYKINSLLPGDISCRDLFSVNDEFHARFSCIHRKYEYHISKRKNPFLEDFSYPYNLKTDVPAMNEAAATLLDYTDFESFSKAHSQVYTFNCKIIEAFWQEDESRDLLIFHIKADRFLRNMVRAIVGTLLDVGKSRLTTLQFKEIIEKKSRSDAGFSVPAKGLFLTEVHYDWAKFKTE